MGRMFLARLDQHSVFHCLMPVFHMGGTLSWLLVAQHLLVLELLE